MTVAYSLAFELSADRSDVLIQLLLHLIDGIIGLVKVLVQSTLWLWYFNICSFSFLPHYELPELFELSLVIPWQESTIIIKAEQLLQPP